MKKKNTIKIALFSCDSSTEVNGTSKLVKDSTEQEHPVQKPVILTADDAVSTYKVSTCLQQLKTIPLPCPSSESHPTTNQSDLTIDSFPAAADAAALPNEGYENSYVPSSGRL